MELGKFRVSRELLAKVLLLPTTWNIVGLKWENGAEQVEIVVDGEDVPAGHDGEILANYMQHDDGMGESGIFVKWQPAPPPGPWRFIRCAKTDMCFWCGDPLGEHVDGDECRVQGAPAFKQRSEKAKS